MPSSLDKIFRFPDNSHYSPARLVALLNFAKAIRCQAVNHYESWLEAYAEHHDEVTKRYGLAAQDLAFQATILYMLTEEHADNPEMHYWHFDIFRQGREVLHQVIESGNSAIYQLRTNASYREKFGDQSNEIQNILDYIDYFDIEKEEREVEIKLKEKEEKRKSQMATDDELDSETEERTEETTEELQNKTEDLFATSKKLFEFSDEKSLQYSEERIVALLKFSKTLRYHLISTVNYWRKNLKEMPNKTSLTFTRHMLDLAINTTIMTILLEEKESSHSEIQQIGFKTILEFTARKNLLDGIIALLPEDLETFRPAMLHTLSIYEFVIGFKIEELETQASLEKTLEEWKLESNNSSFTNCNFDFGDDLISFVIPIQEPTLVEIKQPEKDGTEKGTVKEEQKREEENDKKPQGSSILLEQVFTVESKDFSQKYEILKKKLQLKCDSSSEVSEDSD